ncbi:MAG TPA: glycosyltransferase family 39 protein [Gemmatimonadaceae bacterium]|nr:glycosyltransferase family 39 protein [Gemmatimonadaceae bacterium]
MTEPGATPPSDPPSPAPSRPSREIVAQRAQPVTRPPLAWGLVATIAALDLVVHVATNAAGPYGFHRDEFLYMAMGEHLHLWRMDFPPGIAIVSRATRALLGDSLVAVRLVPALAGMALVVFAALLAREFGGRRFAQGLAALAVLASPLFLRTANLFQPVVLDQLAWTAGLYALAKLGSAGFPDRWYLGGRWWVALGVACGLGLLVKFSVLFFGVGVLVALLATPRGRRSLGTRWPWVAAAIALALGSPSLVGQVRLGWPVIEYSRDLQHTQLARVAYSDFIAGQILLGPAVLLAVAGLVSLWTSAKERAFREVAWACAGAFVVLLLLHGKAYYVGPIYPTLFAAGAAWLERRTARRAPAAGGLPAPRRSTMFTIARAIAILLVLGYGALTLPFGLPLLPAPTMARYARAMGITRAVTTNVGVVQRLPQDYADMLGWEARVAAVARVFNALPPADRARAVVIASNYGEAGAIDFYGPRYGLPHAIATEGTYWYFGPGDKPGDVAVALDDDREGLDRFFGSVTPVVRLMHEYAVPEEQMLTIYVCRHPKTTLQKAWVGLAAER